MRPVPLLEAAAVSLELPDPEGAYYSLADYTRFLPEGLALGEVAFTIRMFKEIGMAVVPGSSFYPSGWPEGKRLIRFAFPKKDATLHEAARRLQSLPTLAI